MENGKWKNVVLLFSLKYLDMRTNRYHPSCAGLRLLQCIPCFSLLYLIQLILVLLISQHYHHNRNFRQRNRSSVLYPVYFSSLHEIFLSSVYKLFNWIILWQFWGLTSKGNFFSKKGILSCPDTDVCFELPE